LRGYVDIDIDLAHIRVSDGLLWTW